jgi:hypothetical protein
MAIEKTQPIAVRLVSKLATSEFLKTENAYTWPMERWTASAAGGISQRLYPGPATMACLSRRDMRILPEGCSKGSVIAVTLRTGG